MKKQGIRLGCATIVMKDGKILLGMRAKDPGRGKWVIPGGGVETFEPMRIAAKREILEETGLAMEIRRFIGPYEIINPPERHRVILYWLADYKSGRIRPSDDTSQARFFSKKEVREMLDNGLITGVVAEVLRDTGWG
jgi:8-oxo-dGTP diphosphatase